VHIGLLCPAWPTNESSNGIVTYVDSLRSELINQGQRVSVFTHVIGQSNKDSGIYSVNPTASSKDLRNLFRRLRWRAHDSSGRGRAIAAAVNEVHQKDPIDVFEMEESFGWCGDVQQLVPMPLVVKLHGPAFLSLVEEDRDTEAAAARINWEGQALRRAAAIVSPSRATLAATLARYDLYPPIQRVIPNPVLIDKNVKPWHLAECDRKTILFVGRFDKRKGGDTVLIAFRRLLEVDKGLRLIFVGPDVGLTSSRGPRIHFHELINSLFTKEQQQRIGYVGQLPRADIFDLRRKAMLTIITSRWENYPNTALEAMIQGCPLVSCDAGSMSEVVDHGDTGLLARAGDIGDLCQKIMCLLSDPSKAAQMGARARQFMTSRHSAAELTKLTIDLYCDVISKAKAAA
jgi:glycosyltransferase involved in cell wall biosynthesis